MLAEGVALNYFANVSTRRINHTTDYGVTYITSPASVNRIARRESGQVLGWWIRTPPVIGRFNQPGTVGARGAIGNSSGVQSFDYIRLGVRPAFRLPNNTPIHQGELNGETVFFVTLN